jgi:hypothetical protein
MLKSSFSREFSPGMSFIWTMFWCITGSAFYHLADPGFLSCQELAIEPLWNRFWGRTAPQHCLWLCYQNRFNWFQLSLNDCRSKKSCCRSCVSRDFLTQYDWLCMCSLCQNGVISCVLYVVHPGLYMYFITTFPACFHYHAWEVTFVFTSKFCGTSNSEV